MPWITLGAFSQLLACGPPGPASTGASQNGQPSGKSASHARAEVAHSPPDAGLAPERKDAPESEAPSWRAKAGERWLIEWSQDLITLATTPRGVRVLPLRQREAKPLLVALDDARPRSLGLEGHLLGELRVEGEEPAPGVHSVIGCAIAEKKLECQEITFHLDARLGLLSSEAGSTGRCVLLEPGGTYFGATPISLLVIQTPSSNPESREGVALRLELGKWGGTAWPWSVETLRKDEIAFKPGDYVLSLTCGAGESAIERVITVNAEGASP